MHERGGSGNSSPGSIGCPADDLVFEIVGSSSAAVAAAQLPASPTEIILPPNTGQAPERDALNLSVAHACSLSRTRPLDGSRGAGRIHWMRV